MDDHAPNDVGSIEAHVRRFATVFAEARDEVQRVILGQEDAVEAVLVALLAGGHVLLEGPPGIGKTLLARSVAKVLGVGFKRIQFTPDLMPSDVSGSNLYDRSQNRFVFREGPIFTEVLLADEINRAPAKTQAALLEAMSDRQVTVDGETRVLPDTFFTIATQNPIESEGTYPLPEAQLDRFMMKVHVEHPDPAVEVQLLQNYLDGFDASDLEAAQLRTVVDATGIQALRGVARRTRVDVEILTYIADIVARTRNDPAVYLGASPRASIALLLCAQVVAASSGRTYVVPDDIKELAGPVLRHRFLLESGPGLEVTPDTVVQRILTDVPVPGSERS